MSSYMYDVLEDQAEELASKIIKRYKSYGIAIAIKDNGKKILKDRFIYRIKILPGTRKDAIEKYAEDVRMSLKLSLFQVIEENTSIFIVASKEFVLDNNLLRILASPEFAEVKANKKIKIPHFVGFDATGKPVITDLTKYPHIMASGTTGSGKTVGLKSLVLSVILGCSQNKVKLLICDKASEFEQFSKIPHLSYPLITDSSTFLKVMLKLKSELDRRLIIKNRKEFAHLPAIVCVADEFLSFLSEIGNKKMINLAAETISAILRRGRHVKIHMVLAAHNPTQKNMLIDLSDIQARMAFQCAKYTNSITILGQGGAEKLRGNGDMLFRSSSNAALQRVQGAFIAPKDIKEALHRVRLSYNNRPPKEIDHDRFLNLKYGFVINEKDLNESEAAQSSSLIISTKTNDEIDTQLFTKIIIWALEHESISGNMICDTFHIGWRRANGFLEKLNVLGITGDMYAKLPRAVLPRNIEDISIETMDFLSKNGIPVNDIAAAIRNRKQ